MPRRPSFLSLRTNRERNAYERAMQVHTYLLQSKARPEEFPPRTRSELAEMFETTPRTVEKYLGSAVRRTREGGWTPSAHDTLVKYMTVITSEGPVHNVPIRDDVNRSIVATHEAAVRQFAERGDPTALRALERRTVTDADGKRYRLVTDERTIRRMVREGELKGVQPY